MATNYERVGRALELLKVGLAPFVEREIQAALRAGTVSGESLRRFVEDPLLAQKPVGEWDVSALLKLMWETWNGVFRKTLGYSERSLVSELRDWRNKWAHQEAFQSDDVYRVLDSASRLLSAVSALEVAEVERQKQELLRARYDEQVRNERRKAGGSLVKAAQEVLKPWREVITPHPDVASGRFQQAEFAADLWQVYRGEGSDEYRDAAEFFRRTYLTASLHQLLVQAIRRLTGQGGDPVVQLQTNFGGGKTHAMLALYHLFSGTPPTALSGLEEVLREAGTAPPPARRVVLVGNRISPGNPMVKPDGTVVRTLWGELAWQLGGRAAYDRIRADDERATNPGDALRQLFNDYGPCLILIDEWVAYARQLHEEQALPAGSFETQFTFAQALTESARAARSCLLVVSLPASDSPQGESDDTEVGGLRGREALDRLRNVIGRMESSWRPASGEESFEIVRRRLFQPLTEPEQFRSRDVTARTFGEYYHTQTAEFPPECREAAYEHRLKAAYPIHPEVFDRLYTDWSTLVRFQRTRGVLRLMAAVIHRLWEDGDRTPLIMPATLPIGDMRVRFELTRYLSDNWTPVIERDVDGPEALSLRLDQEVPNLGRYSACQRVARTIFLGSAPIATAAHPGIEDRRIKLGCVLPGEAPALTGDALRRMAGAATYLYHEGNRYWYSTQPTVTKIAEDRAEQLRRDPAVTQEIEQRLREEARQRGEFSRVHPCPQASQDIPDELEARLVIFGPGSSHGRNDPESGARQYAQKILEWRGTAPRRFRNTVVFLAADRTRLQDLEAVVRRLLAWQSILRDKEALNLAPAQVRQAEEQQRAEETRVAAQIPETYQWLLVPTQRSPDATVEWQEFRLQEGGALVERASKKLSREELLVMDYAGTQLRRELDRVPLWRGDHVAVKQLSEDFASYLYLPRLAGPETLLRGCEAGVALLTWEQDGFAYAERYDEGARRYRGLRAGQGVTVLTSGLIVKPEAALRQLAEEERRRKDTSVVPSTEGGDTTGSKGTEGTGDGGTGEKSPPSRAARRFHGSVALDPLRVGRDASKVAEEVIAHLASLPEARVRVTLEIEAEVANGIPEREKRIVEENSRALRFAHHDFEQE